MGVIANRKAVELIWKAKDKIKEKKEMQNQDQGIVAIVYTSNTGFSKEYAELLAKELELPVYSLDEAGTQVKKGAEIIYFGWLMAGQVKGYKKAAKSYQVKAVCGVGMAACGKQDEDIRKKNKVSDSTAVFSLQGGFELERLTGMYKFMMKSMKNTLGKSLEKKENITEEEKEMLNLLMNGGNKVSLDNLQPVIDWYR